MLRLICNAGATAGARVALPAMSQVRTITHPAKRKKVLDRAKGFVGRSKNILSAASRRTNKAAQYSYRDRRTKKREFRSAWITAVNSGAREHGIKYSELIHAMDSLSVVLNRKMLAELAIAEPRSFAKICEFIKPEVEAKRVEDLARNRAQPRPKGAVSLVARSYTVGDIAAAIRKAKEPAAAASK